MFNAWEGAWVNSIISALLLLAFWGAITIINFKDAVQRRVQGGKYDKGEEWLVVGKFGFLVAACLIGNFCLWFTKIPEKGVVVTTAGDMVAVYPDGKLLAACDPVFSQDGKTTCAVSYDSRRFETHVDLVHGSRNIRVALHGRFLGEPKGVQTYVRMGEKALSSKKISDGLIRKVLDETIRREVSLGTKEAELKKRLENQFRSLNLKVEALEFGTL